MNWHKPELVEIKMDAEINAYQQDDSDVRPVGRDPLAPRDPKSPSASDE
jgi:hypothetical protein